MLGSGSPYLGAAVTTDVTFWKPSLTHWGVPRPAWPDLTAHPAARSPRAILLLREGGGSRGPISLHNGQVSAGTARADLSHCAHAVAQGLVSLAQPVSVR